MPGLIFHTWGKQLVLWVTESSLKTLEASGEKNPKLKPQARTKHKQVTFADFASPHCLLIPTFVGDHSPPIGNSDWL